MPLVYGGRIAVTAGRAPSQTSSVCYLLAIPTHPFLALALDLALALFVLTTRGTA